jgi:hypothetical protein
MLEPMREFAPDFAQFGCGRTAGETRKPLIDFFSEGRHSGGNRFFGGPVRLLHFSYHQCPLLRLLPLLIDREAEAPRR